jgi:ectoine hydroxylase-related dioxygenase (phytanoyl-CoA dioxygenase family)
VIPGTHIMDPKKIKYERAEMARQAIQVPMRLGDALVFSGHLMHSGMVNRSSAIRTSVQAFYVRRGLEHFIGEGLEEPTNETLDRLGDLALLLI